MLCRVGALSLKEVLFRDHDCDTEIYRVEWCFKNMSEQEEAVTLDACICLVYWFFRFKTNRKCFILLNVLPIQVKSSLNKRMNWKCLKFFSFAQYHRYINDFVHLSLGFIFTFSMVRDIYWTVYLDIRVSIVGKKLFLICTFT